MLDETLREREAEIAERVRGATGPLRIVGGGTRPVVSGPGDALSVTGLSGITLYEPGALTLVAEAGTPVAEIEAALGAEGQTLPFEPIDHRGLFGTDGAPTIGGVVAAAASGPRRVASGAVRDFLLGVRFVDGTGTLIKSGGRVMKNVTGYDLAKLMCGAWGTLGVLTEVAFKVLPRAEAAAMLTLSGLETPRAIEAMAAAMGSPFEVTGAAHDPEAGTITLRIEGFEEQMAYRSGRLAEVLAAFGAAEITRERVIVAAHWAGIRDVAMAHDQPGDLWRVSVKPSDGARVAAALPGARLMFDWAGGLVSVLAPEGTDVRGALTGIPGHATLWRASDETRAAFGTFQPEAPAVAALSAGLRARFDPKGLLNPGAMG